MNSVFLPWIRTWPIAESHNDANICKIFADKLLKPKKWRLKYKNDSFSSLGRRVQVNDLEEIKEAYLRTTKEPPELILVITDADNDPELKRQMEKHTRTSGLPDLVFAFPERNIESWLIADLKAVKEALGVKALPGPKRDRKFDAKDWLENIIGQNFSGNTYGVKVKIAQKANISVVRRTDKSFNSFCSELEKFISHNRGLKIQFNRRDAKLRPEVYKQLQRVRRRKNPLPWERRRKK